MTLPCFIKAVTYDAAKSELRVQFLTSTYYYSGVPQHLADTFAGLQQKYDIVSAFDRFVEGKFQSRRGE